MRKKIIVFLMLLVILMIPCLGVAQNEFVQTPATVVNQNVNQQVISGGNQSSQITGTSFTNLDVDKTIDEAGTQVSNLAELVLKQVADKSTPLCALLLIYGAVLYFIMGIRNLYRKRQGLLMMWGSLTFWVIAQVAYVVFWLMGTKF